MGSGLTIRPLGTGVKARTDYAERMHLAHARHLALLAVAITAFSLTPAAAHATQGDARLVAAANVRLRSAPSEEVTIVTTLPLGTDVIVMETSPDRAWLRVRTTDGREGWMRETYSLRVPPGQFARVAQTIVARRLHRTGDGFSAWLELQQFIERVRPQLPDRESEARFALFRLQAIAGAAGASGRRYRPATPELAAWREAHAALIGYNEPGGRWILRRDVILAEHDQFRGTVAADEIAWLAVSNGLAGECEGDVLCYLTWDDLLWAEYLRRMPAGRYVTIALRELRERATYYREDLIPRPGFFNAADDCGKFRTALAPIREAAAAADPSRSGVRLDRERTLAALDALRVSACGKRPVSMFVT